MYSTTTSVSARTIGASQSNLVPNTGQTGIRGGLNIMGPQATTKTSYNASFGEDGGIINFIAGAYTLTTSFDGFSILGTSMTGDIQVYGYK